MLKNRAEILAEMGALLTTSMIQLHMLSTPDRHERESRYLGRLIDVRPFVFWQLAPFFFENTTSHVYFIKELTCTSERKEGLLTEEITNNMYAACTIAQYCAETNRVFDVRTHSILDEKQCTVSLFFRLME
jgi:hypothetical protein